MRVHFGAAAGFRAICFAAALSCGAVAATAQESGAASQAGSAPRQTGTVKAVHAHDFVLTTAGGEVDVSVGGSSKVLIVTPDVKKLSDAPAGSITDIQPGDRASVTGTAGDVAPSFNATRVLVMKSSTVSAVHAADSAAWAQGVGGIVKTVSPDAITVSSGMKSVNVQTTSSTVVRRYAPGSVNFADATTSTVSAIQPGDQLRARGVKAPDGSSITADEIVSGNFKNYSGTIASIDPASSSITLKDLTTKKTVTVAVVASSDIRRLSTQMATGIAARMRGGAAGEGGAEGAARPAGGEGGGGGQYSRGSGGAGGPGGPGGGYGGRSGGGAGADLSRMISRLPTETLGGLKQGDAVMIVATAPGTEGGKATAITLLAGVEPILAAPAGQSTQLSPWNMGGGGGEGDMGGGGGGGQQ